MNGLIAIFFVLVGLFIAAVVVAMALAALDLWVEFSIRDLWVGLKITTFQGTTHVMMALVPCVVVVARRRCLADVVAPPSRTIPRSARPESIAPGASAESRPEPRSRKSHAPPASSRSPGRPPRAA
jgi:hypothetical protein